MALRNKASRKGSPCESRILLAVGLAAVLAALVAACGADDDGDAGTESADQPLTLGVSFTALTPYDVVQDVFIDQELAEIDGEKIGPVANNFDAGKQISDIRSLVTGGANGLFVRPADSQALGPAIDFAADNGASVVVVDDTVENNDNVFMNVKADNLKMGENACKAMGQALEGEGKVLSLDGDPATANGRDRTEGFNACMESEFPGIEVINRPTNWETEKAANATQTVLGANPDLNGIYLQSETLFLAPVLSAVRNAGRTANLEEDDPVVLVGIDGTPQALDAIRDGDIYAVVSQPIPLYARYGVLYNVAAQAGETFTPGATDHDSEIVETGETLTDLLTAPVVTSDNVDDPDLWGNSPEARE